MADEKAANIASAQTGRTLKTLIANSHPVNRGFDHIASLYRESDGGRAPQIAAARTYVRSEVADMIEVQNLAQDEVAVFEGSRAGTFLYVGRHEGELFSLEDEGVRGNPLDHDTGYIKGRGKPLHEGDCEEIVSWLIPVRHYRIPWSTTLEGDEAGVEEITPGLKHSE